MYGPGFTLEVPTSMSVSVSTCVRLLLTRRSCHRREQRGTPRYDSRDFYAYRRSHPRDCSRIGVDTCISYKPDDNGTEFASHQVPSREIPGPLLESLALELAPVPHLLYPRRVVQVWTSDSDRLEWDDILSAQLSGFRLGHGRRPELVRSADIGRLAEERLQKSALCIITPRLSERGCSDLRRSS